MAHWLAGIDGRRVTVEVPASSANLGAGYDCLGVALALIDRVELEVRGWSRGEIDLTVDGERHPLAAGDSATFDADLPHSLTNPGATAAEILAVIAAGLRRS